MSVRLGLTEQISLSRPSDYDVLKSEQLVSYLHDHGGSYESGDKEVVMEEVLGVLDKIVKNWVKEICMAKGFSEQLM